MVLAASLGVLHARRVHSRQHRVKGRRQQHSRDDEHLGLAHSGSDHLVWFQVEKRRGTGQHKEPGRAQKVETSMRPRRDVLQNDLCRPSAGLRDSTHNLTHLCVVDELGEHGTVDDAEPDGSVELWWRRIQTEDSVQSHVRN